jgi:hypothetical protein
MNPGQPQPSAVPFVPLHHLVIAEFIRSRTFTESDQYFNDVQLNLIGPAHLGKGHLLISSSPSSSTPRTALMTSSGSFKPPPHSSRCYSLWEPAFHSLDKPWSSSLDPTLPYHSCNENTQSVARLKVPLPSSAVRKFLQPSSSHLHKAVITMRPWVVVQLFLEIVRSAVVSTVMRTPHFCWPPQYQDRRP